MLRAKGESYYFYKFVLCLSCGTTDKYCGPQKNRSVKEYTMTECLWNCNKTITAFMVIGVMQRYGHGTDSRQVRVCSRTLTDSPRPPGIWRA